MIRLNGSLMKKRLDSTLEFIRVSQENRKRQENEGLQSERKDS